MWREVLEETERVIQYYRSRKAEGRPVDPGYLMDALTLKSKVVNDMPTYPTVQLYADSLLAYANLTWQDVQAVPVSGFAAGQTAVLQGAVDIAAVSGQSAAAYELKSSVHGIRQRSRPVPAQAVIRSAPAVTSASSDRHETVILRR